MTSLADLVSQMLEGGVAYPIVIETIRFWEDGQSLDAGSDELARRRVKDRNRKRLERLEGKKPSKDNLGQSNEGVGVSLTSLSSQIIKVKEGSKTPLPPKPSSDNADNHLAIDEWNRMAKAHGLAPVQSRNAERLRATQSRLKECGGKDGWAQALILVTQSPGLLGENDRGWKMDFDAFTSKKKFTKLMEGGYANWKPRDESNSSGAGVDQALAKFRKLHEGGPPDANGENPGFWDNGFAEGSGGDETGSGFQDYPTASGMGRR